VARLFLDAGILLIATAADLNEQDLVTVRGARGSARARRLDGGGAY